MGLFTNQRYKNILKWFIIITIVTAIFLVVYSSDIYYDPFILSKLSYAASIPEPLTTFTD